MSTRERGGKERRAGRQTGRQRQTEDFLPPSPLPTWCVCVTPRTNKEPTQMGELDIYPYNGRKNSCSTIGNDPDEWGEGIMLYWKVTT